MNTQILKVKQLAPQHNILLTNMKFLKNMNPNLFRETFKNLKFRSALATTLAPRKVVAEKIQGGKIAVLNGRFFQHVIVSIFNCCFNSMFQIGHDGVLSAQGWFVKNVEIDMPQSGKNYHFPCGRWMAKDKDDGLLQRTISVMDASATIYKPSKLYLAYLKTTR